MPGRFSLGPLTKGLGEGVRNRRTVGQEKVDWFAAVVLAVFPLAAFGFSVYRKTLLESPADLIAGCALLVGVGLAAFGQVAAWRERLNQRGRSTEAIYARSLDEAVVHILLSVLAAGLATALLVTLSNFGSSASAGDLKLWVMRLLTAACIGLFVYLGLTLIIIVNLLWDGYDSANRP